MKQKIILDLCGGTGAWSKPYKDAGYTVYNITLPDFDVTSQDVYTYCLNLKPYGILAAPPCTMFSLARTRAKKPRDLEEGMEVVRACLDIIWGCRYQGKLAFWALENPMGYLRQFLGKAPYMFDPSDFGERYTKKTELWGYFNFPVKKPIVLTAEEKALMSTNSRKLPSITDITGSKQAAKRAITPAEFAKAFYRSNT